MRPILESPEILKTGVGIKEDVKELRKMADFSPAGFVEISELTDKLGYQNRGLRALAGLLLGGRISKAAQVSNWARQNSTPSKSATPQRTPGSVAKSTAKHSAEITDCGIDRYHRQKD